MSDVTHCRECGHNNGEHSWDCAVMAVKVRPATVKVDRTPLDIVSQTLSDQLAAAKDEQERAEAFFQEAVQRREHAMMAVHLIESALRGLNSETTVSDYADPLRRSIEGEKERLQARAMGRNL